MKSFRRLAFLLAVLSLFLIGLNGCFKIVFNENAQSETETHSEISTDINSANTEMNHADNDIYSLIQSSVKVIAVGEDVPPDEATSSTDLAETSGKEITVSIVDLSKIYAYLKQENKTELTDLDKLTRIVTEKKDDPDFRTEYVINAQVQFVGDEWVLESNDALKEIYKAQMEIIMADRIAAIEEIEVDEIQISTEDRP